MSPSLLILGDSWASPQDTEACGYQFVTYLLLSSCARRQHSCPPENWWKDFFWRLSDMRISRLSCLLVMVGDSLSMRFSHLWVSLLIWILSCIPIVLGDSVAMRLSVLWVSVWGLLPSSHVVNSAATSQGGLAGPLWEVEWPVSVSVRPALQWEVEWPVSVNVRPALQWEVEWPVSVNVRPPAVLPEKAGRASVGGWVTCGGDLKAPSLPSCHAGTQSIATCTGWVEQLLWGGWWPVSVNG